MCRQQGSLEIEKAGEFPWTHNEKGWLGKFNPHMAYGAQER